MNLSKKILLRVVFAISLISTTHLYADDLDSDFFEDSQFDTPLITSNPKDAFRDGGGFSGGGGGTGVLLKSNKQWVLFDLLHFNPSYTGQNTVYTNQVKLIKKPFELPLFNQNDYLLNLITNPTKKSLAKKYPAHYLAASIKKSWGQLLSIPSSYLKFNFDLSIHIIKHISVDSSEDYNSVVDNLF